jgi:hypothetical protein
MIKVALIIEIAPQLAAQAMQAAQAALAPFVGASAMSAAAPLTPPATPLTPPANTYAPPATPAIQSPSNPPPPPVQQPAPAAPGQVQQQELYPLMQAYAAQHRADGVSKVFDAIGCPSRSLAACTPEQLSLAKQWFQSMQLPA